MKQENEKKSVIPEFWFKHNSWEISDALLLYYGYTPGNLKDYSTQESQAIIERLDTQNIRRLLLDYLSPIHGPYCRIVEVQNFIKFLHEKEIPIPSHFPESIVNSDNDQPIIKPSTRKMKPESLRKEIVRMAALLFWDKEKKKHEEQYKTGSIPYTKPGVLATKEPMKKLVHVINEIGGLPPIKDNIDPEWFSDLYPGDKKPGPKSKRKT